MMKRALISPLILAAAASFPACNGGDSSPAAASDSGSNALEYPIVDTAQTSCFDVVSALPCPAASAPFYGQDAQFNGNQPSYALSADGLTVHDNVTGLSWQKSPDTNGDGLINASDKMTLTQAQARPAGLNAVGYGGFSDWRLPTIKELYSLMNFMGLDPSGATGNDTSALTPFIDRAFFDFGYGDTAAGERVIDAQFASSTLYVNKVMLGDAALFGVNFADGRIKGYDLVHTMKGAGDAAFYVRCVRGAAYGENDFVDNGDGTITDRATTLMWTRDDSGKGLNWQEALAWAQAKNSENYLGHNDWRLPNTKELQSIVDYSRSPDTTSSAAINPLFNCTGITNEAGKPDYPFYWTGTTHISQGGGPSPEDGGVPEGGPPLDGGPPDGGSPDGAPPGANGIGGSAVYVAFGRAMGFMTAPWDPTLSAWLDVHGAGAQRSDPKQGNPADYPEGHGAQGDAIRIYNYVRLVR